MQYGFKTMIVRREVSLGPKISDRATHFNVESKKAIM
jgi:hypothetical protein